MSDVSAVTNLLLTANEGFTSTVGSTGVSSGGATVPLTNVSGLTNGSTFVGIVEPGLTNQQTFTGIVDTAGSQITSVVWTRGTNVAHAAGVTIVDYMTGTAINMITKALATHANQDGTLKNNAVTNTVIADNAVTTSKLVNANVTFAKLASTIFSGQLGTWTPTGTAATSGTSIAPQQGYYVNLGGIKLAWVTVQATNTSAGSVSCHYTGITMPPSFFSTVQAWFPTIQTVGNAANQHVSGDSVQTAGGFATTFNFYVDGSLNSSSAVVSSLFIGT